MKWAVHVSYVYSSYVRVLRSCADILFGYATGDGRQLAMPCKLTSSGS